MKNLRTVFRRLVERRSGRGRWVYALCCLVVLVFALVASAMGGLVAGLIYLPAIALCLVQFFRPMLLGWFVLVVAFSAYTIAVAVRWESLTRLDSYVFLVIGLVPALTLLRSRPIRIPEN